MSKKQFIVQIGKNHYIKRTCRFGPYHGSVIITNDKNEARIWSREKDARSAAHVASYRRENYPEDAQKIPKGSIKHIDITAPPLPVPPKYAEPNDRLVEL